MQVDWLTVTAQIVNFLILVWLLQHFLYTPVMRAMERREQRIQDRLHEAEEKEREAGEEAQRYRDEQDALEHRRAKILEDAREVAEKERKSLERAAREEVEARKRDWLAHVERQRDEFFRELSQRASEQFFRLARKAMADLADAALEDQVAERFIRQIEDLKADARKRIARACADAGDKARIRSRFELAPETKRKLTRAVHEHLAEGAEVSYERSDELLCGIELRAGSQTLDWSLRGYLEGLETAVDERLSSVLTQPREEAAAS